MLRLGILVSGAGSNLQAIIDGVARKEIPADIAVVISDVAEAYALKRAAKHGLPRVFLDPALFRDREAYDRELAAILHAEKVDLVALAGFMRLLSPFMVRQFPGRILNIHPSLLPAFPGMNAVAQALAYGVKVSGCTLHFVDEGLDTGPILLQEAVAVEEGDTVESLHQRIHKVEHRLYPRGISLVAQKKVKIEGRRCIIYE